jgi:hypothetical protein
MGRGLEKGGTAGGGHPPHYMHEYQNKGVAKSAFHK